MAVAVALTLGVLGLSAVGLASPAAADTAPVAPETTPTVSADALPTVQVDGVVWSQVVVGTTVYAVGRFAQARPAGSAAGTNTTPRANALAYNLTTGALISGWAPSLNAQALSVAASPDGSRIYLGGDFSTVNGTTRNRIAAVDATTGALVAGFAPSVSSRVRSIVPTASAVYLGGAFTTVSGQSRTRLAAVNPATGGLLAWAPTADQEVMALTAAGPGQIVAGGHFTTVNGSSQIGMTALDATTGAIRPWAVNQVLQDYGPDAAIYSLSYDGSQVYGSGYGYLVNGTAQSNANLENTFAATADGGQLVWANGCLGDTYSQAPLGGVLYGVGHPHNCSAIGAFPQTDPWTYQRAMATTTTRGPGDAVNLSGALAGRPAPQLLHWLPTLAAGSYTGQGQAAWSVTGNADYVVLGGEFPTVNGAAQQGLVRFAVRSIAPNAQGPQGSSDLKPAVTGLAPGALRVSWKAAWDRDNRQLTYEVLRGATLGSATVIATRTLTSAWWNRPAMAFTDRGAAPGSSQTYRVRVRDALGNSVVSATTAGTVPSGVADSTTYSDAVTGDGATSLWRLGETSGTTGYDWAGGDDLTEDASLRHGTPGALAGATDAATSFPGTVAVPAGTAVQQPGPQTFSVEAWFRTTSTSGGKLVGFGDQSATTSSNYDRHVYLTNDGRVVFGVYPNAVRTVSSAAGFNDGKWHHVVAALGAAGMTLYLDGAQVGTRADTTSAQPFAGYWRLGGDNLGGWPDQPASSSYAGDLDEVAVYPTALSGTQVARHFRLAAPAAPNQLPTAAFTSSVTDLAASFDASGSADPDGTIASYAWNFGDGASGAGVAASHAYAAAGTYPVTLTVTDNAGGTAKVSHDVSVTSPPNQKPSAAFAPSCTDLACSFDGSASADPDGTIASYAWDFGDGASGSGVAPRHTYASPGTYTVKLTVTDNRGGTDTQSQPVRVSAANQSPAAVLTPSCTNLACTFSSAGSADPDGSIASYAWTFGDGGTASTANPAHTYTAAGTYTVKLVLTDDRGATGTASSTVSVAPAGNVNPTAAFAPSCTNLACSFDGTASADPDGTVAGYAWTFGDGGTATGSKPSHTYPAAGTFAVTLTVTDNRGGTGTASQQVTVAASNQSPVARFTPSCSNLACSFSGSASSDPDGSVAGYAWSFGDGATASGATPGHTFAAAGTYPVTLTVTDDRGATGSTSQAVTVTAVAAPLAADAFGRTVANGWGSAETGGAWTVSGPGSNFAVSGGQATQRLATPSQGVAATLNGVSATSTDTRVTVVADKVVTGNGVYVWVTGRKVGANEYRGRVRLLASGGVAVQISRYVSGTETAIGGETTVPGLTYAAGTPLRLRLQVDGTGTTTLRFKAWRADSAEPSDWQRTGTDSTAGFQSAGGIGLAAYLSGSSTSAPVTVGYDDLTVTPV